MGLKLENNLDIKIDVYLSREVGSKRDPRGAGYKDENGKHKSEVNSHGDCLPLDMTGIEKSYECILKVKQLPNRNGVDGIRVSPGTGMGTIHDIEHHRVGRNGNKVLIIMHFTDRPSDDKDHVDPIIEHPESPGDISMSN